MLEEKAAVYEIEKHEFLREKDQLLKEKEQFLAEIDQIQSKARELEDAKTAVLQENSRLINTYQESFQRQNDEFLRKTEEFLKETATLKEKLDVSCKKNGFLTTRIFELNRELEALREKGPQKNAVFEEIQEKDANYLIRAPNSRKSFELLSDSLTLKLNNLEKLFENEGRLQKIKENGPNVRSFAIKKEVFSQEEAKKPGFRSISAKRERDTVGKGEKIEERRDFRRKIKHEFESEFVKRFKHVITQLEARLDNFEEK